MQIKRTLSASAWNAGEGLRTGSARRCIRRMFLEPLATRILAFEGDSQVE